jgi:hypothetical protein
MNLSRRLYAVLMFRSMINSKRVARQQTLVCARILEQNDLAFFQVEARLLSEKEICSFYYVLEVRLALRVNKRRHVRNVYCFWSAGN